MAGPKDPTQIAQLVLVTLVILVLDLILLTATVALIPVWLIVSAVAKIWRPDLGPIISDMSSIFTLKPADECAGSLIHYLILDGTMEKDRFRELWMERVMHARRLSGDLMFPRFRDTWTEFLGYSFWKPEQKFSLKRHIRDYDLKGDLALPSPCRSNDLKRVIGGIAGKLYTRDRSPWEILLIQNYRADNDPRPKTVIVVRHHHALIDGYGLVSMIRHLFETKYPLPRLQFPKPPLWYRILAPLKMPYDSAVMTLNSTDGLKEWRTAQSENTVQLEGSMTSAITIEKVKSVKNRLKVSYNAVLFAAIAGGFERMIKEEKLNIPESLGIHYPVPRPGHPGGTVNHAYMVGMGWKIKSLTPIQRIRSMQQAFTDLKYSTIPEMAGFMSLFLHTWPTVMRRALFHNAIANGSAVVSSFPATEDTIYFDGIKVHDLISSVGALGRLSLAVLITGMNGNQHIVVTGNARVFPAHGFRKLGGYIEQELNAMLAL